MTSPQPNTQDLANFEYLHEGDSDASSSTEEAQPGEQAEMDEEFLLEFDTPGQPNGNVEGASSSAPTASFPKAAVSGFGAAPLRVVASKIGLRQPSAVPNNGFQPSGVDGASTSGNPVHVQPPVPITFEGSGLAEVGTARKKLTDTDDEFEYAFDGGKREVVHQQVFRPKAMPAHLVTNVKQQLLSAVVQEGEEEEEDSIESLMHESGTRSNASEPEYAEGSTGQLSPPEHSKPWLNKHASWTTFHATDTFTSLAEQHEPESPKGMMDHTHTGLKDQADLPSMHLIRALSLDRSNATSDPTHTATTATATTVGSTSGSLMRVQASIGSNLGGLQPSIDKVDQASVQSVPSLHSSTPALTTGDISLGTGTSGSTSTLGLSSARLDSKRSHLTSSSSITKPGKVPTQPSLPIPEPLDEWEAANLQREQDSRNQAERTASTVGTVSYQEAVRFFMSMDLSQAKQQAQAGLPPAASLMARLLCMAPPDLKPPLKEQQLQILGLAKVPFSDEEPMHFRLLCSLYAAFTGKSSDQPRFGPHWADVGFQGDDPATDLRSCGMLGLLQLYYLYEADASNALKIFRLSQHRVQEFPLSIVSMNITKWTLQALREGLLSQHANMQDSALDAAQSFFVGVCYTFYNMWLSGNKTMKQSGFVLKELEALAKKKPCAMIQAASKLLPEPV